MKFSLCIPMYNEASIIEQTAKTLSAYMSAHFEDYEIIFSDDGSKDNSAELVRALALPCVRVVGYSVNRGRLRRNRNRRIEKPCLRLLRSVRIDLHRRKFDYAVLSWIDPGGLYIEHDKGTVQLEFKCHYLLFSRISGAGGLL